MYKAPKIPAESIIIDSDKYKTDSFVLAATNVLPWLQEVIDAFEIQQTGRPVSIQIIQDLLYHQNGPEDYVRDILAGTEEVMIGKLPLSRNRVKEMIEAPNVRQLFKPVNTLKEVFQTFKRIHYVGLETFEIIEGKAQVSAKAIQEAEHRNTRFAETDAEKEAWLITLEIKERLEYLKEKHNVTLLDDGNPARGILRQLFEGFPAKSTVRIDTYLLKNQVNRKNRY